MSDYRQRLYDSYAKERERLNSASLEAGGRYDRIVITLGGGALALSLTFIEKIAPSPCLGTIWILIVAWSSLLVCVVLQLLALASSQDAVRLQIERLDAEYGYYFASDNPEDAVRNRMPEDMNRFTVRATRFNDWSRYALICGMLLLFAFSAVNMSTKGNENDRKEGDPATTATSSATNRTNHQ